MNTARASFVIGVLGIVLFPASVWSAPPTISDFATCNAEADEKTTPPSALPRGSEERASSPESARPRASAPAPTGPPMPSGAGREPTDPSGTLISGASNPQLEGMEAARASDPEYRAAYQSCMRRRGF
jgi:hypothetical protein